MKAMFSYIALYCYALTFISCHVKLAPQTGTRINKELKDQHGNPALLGSWPEEKLRTAPYDQWFVPNYQAYAVDSAAADTLSRMLRQDRFLIFLGTWCGDSKREVPRMLKILHTCGIPPSAIQLVMVSDADSLFKQSPGHEEKDRDIFRVPDLIVLKKGHEIGRIIESPVVSLEKDLLAIARGSSYRPHYAGAALLASMMRIRTPAAIGKDLPEAADRLKPLTVSAAELASYARVLKAAGENDKAALAEAINAILFPPVK